MGNKSHRALHAIVRILSFTLNVKLFKCFMQTSDIYGLNFRKIPLFIVVENKSEEDESAGRKMNQMLFR